nr:zinc finger, CCHC-type [Tanacetum cinerariifolium]
DDLSLVQLGSHLRIEESLKAQDNDKGKCKEVGGPSVNMTEEGAFYVQVDAIAWWIDSGATTHVCKDRCWFKTYEPVEDGSVLYMGDDHFALVHGKRSVSLEFSSEKTITLFNVLYVPKLLVDYDEDYQGDAVQNNFKDPLTSAMILVARAITQCFSNPTNNRLRTSSNIISRAIVQGDKHDFLFANALWIEETEELSANICLMARIQPSNFDYDEGPCYDFAYLSEVQTPSTSYVNPLFAKDTLEQKYPKQPKIINNTISDDQIDSNIIFDKPNGDVNSGSVEYDNNVHESYAFEQLARNAYKEAEKQQIIAKNVQQQNTVLTKQLYENKDKYHDTILDLEARAKKNEDVVLKMGNSLQGMFMLRPKPLPFYDLKVKHGFGYTNPYTLKKAISQNLKLYDASCLDDSKIQMNVRDNEDIFDDATKSQIKMKRKSQDPIAMEKKQNVWTIDYKKLYALYEDFVPQEEFSAEQKYFSSSFISSENSSKASSPSLFSETKPTVTPMPSANPMLVDLNQMENDFNTLFELLQTNSKRESIFYTSLE